MSILEAMKLGYFLEEVFDLKIWPIVLHGDNQASLSIINSLSSGHVTKYLGTKFFLVSDLIKEGKVISKFVKSELNPADGFTKALGKMKFEIFKNCCFVCDFIKNQGNVKKNFSSDGKIQFLGMRLTSSQLACADTKDIAVDYNRIKELDEEIIHQCCLCLLGQISSERTSDDGIEGGSLLTSGLTK